MPIPIGTRIPEVPQPTPEVKIIGGELQAEQSPPSPERPPDVKPVDLVPSPSTTPAPAAIRQPVDQLVKNIEGAMADGLEDAYQAMDPATRRKFKQVGEATASAIGKLLEQSKIQVKKIVTLLLRWLRLIPQVNPYYLEQQAKIKADVIVALKHPPRKGN